MQTSWVTSQRVTHKNKSLMGTLHVHTAVCQEAPNCQAPNNETIKPIALVIVEIRLSEGVNESTSGYSEDTFWP